MNPHIPEILLLICDLHYRDMLSTVTVLLTDEGPTTQHPEYDCHCHNCIQNYRCPSRHGCFFRYNNVTKETEQDCLRDEHSALVSCTPTFSRTRHLTEYSRVVGDVHFYCCRGHNCNEKHPAFPDGELVGSHSILFSKSTACYKVEDAPRS